MYYSKCKTGYVLRLEVGEEIQEALRRFAETVSLKGAAYQGIGAITSVELAFFCVETKNYDRKFLNEEYEMTSLLGNLTYADGSYLPHTHVTLGDRNFQTYSGHLVRGVVSVTAEIIVRDLQLSLSRKEDPILQYKGLISPDRVHLQVDN